MYRPPPPTVRPKVRILGIDPGLHLTGYAVVESRGDAPVILEAGVVTTAEAFSATDMAPRLTLLYNGIVEVIDMYAPDVVAVEQLFAHPNHPRTSILMAHARGILLLAAGQRNIPVASYNPTRVKKTLTGNGHAGKEQVQHAVALELNLPGPPEPPDVADALAVALCHYYTLADPAAGAT